jgi:hypothetical protein
LIIRLPAAENGLDGAIDGDFLVVAQRFVGAVEGRRQQPVGVVFGQGLCGAIALPQFDGRWELCELGFTAPEQVDLDDGLAVGGVCEREPQNDRVVFGLLDAVARGFVPRLGFNHGDGDIARVSEDKVGALARLASWSAGCIDDSPVGEAVLLVEAVRRVVPTRFADFGHDVARTSVGFGQRHVLSRSEKPPFRAMELGSAKQQYKSKSARDKHFTDGAGLRSRTIRVVFEGVEALPRPPTRDVRTNA